MRSLDAPDAKAQNVDKYHTYEGGLGVTDNEQAIAVLNAVKLSKKGVVNGIAALDKDGKIPQSVIPDNDIVQVSIKGPTAVYYAETYQFVISNYDMFTDYTIAAVTGSVVRIKDTIIYTAPNSGTNGGFWINGRLFNIALTQAKPATPTISAPTEEGTINTNSYTFISSAYATLGNPGVHTSTDWELSTVSNFTSTVASSYNDTVNKASWNVTGLVNDARLFVRVRYKAVNGNTSDWSTTRTFNLVIPTPVTPSITSPVNNATGLAIAPTITTSTFTALSDGSTHVSTTWQIATDIGFTNFVSNSGSDTVNKTSRVFSGLALNTSYFVRARHSSSNGKISDWSTAVTFRTLNRLAVTVTLASNINNYTFNTAKVPGYLAGIMDVTLLINGGVVVGAANTGSYALNVDTSWAAGDTVKIVNNGYIVGAGGGGGRGGYGGNPGTAGGPAIRAQHATNVTNNGIIGGGGGGGGSGGSSIVSGTNGGSGSTFGGAGGGGAGNIAGLGSDNYFYGSAAGGTLTSGGAGGAGGGAIDNRTGMVGGTGGTGGNLGQAGTAGTGSMNDLYPQGTGPGGGGGAGGYAVVGSGFVTWTTQGTVYGPQQ